MFLTPHLYVSLSQCLYAMLTFFVSRMFYKVAQKKQLMFWIFSQWVHFHASRRAMCGGKPTWQISVDRGERVRADCSLINQLDDEWHHYLGQIIKLKLKLSFQLSLSIYMLQHSPKPGVLKVFAAKDPLQGTNFLQIILLPPKQRLADPRRPQFENRCPKQLK